VQIFRTVACGICALENQLHNAIIFQVGLSVYHSMT